MKRVLINHKISRDYHEKIKRNLVEIPASRLPVGRQGKQGRQIVLICG